VVIVVLVVVVAVFIVAVGALAAYVLYLNGQRGKIRARLLAEFQESVSKGRWFPLRFSSQTRFKSIYKIFPWEGAGIVVILPTELRFVGETSRGKRIDLRLAPGETGVKWLGNRHWFLNALLSWFEVQTAAGESWNFTSETGPFIFGSEATTREIFQALVTAGARTIPSPEFSPRASQLKVAGMVLAIALLVGALAGGGFYYFVGSGVRGMGAGLEHYKRNEYKEAIGPLESARDSDFMSTGAKRSVEALLADSYMHVGRYEDALDAAYREQRYLRQLGETDDPIAYLTLGKALSFRYAQTHEAKFKDDSRAQLVLFVEKAGAKKMTKKDIFILTAPSKYRLATGELQTDEEFNKRNYP
jgi:hypothetical protein